MTHRAIRPDNVLSRRRGQQVTLGAAWAAPPAMHQPTVFEAPFSAMCHPAGRGDGTSADDIYALGVLLLVLAAGQIPMANLDDATIISRKLDLGSFAALTAGVVVPPSSAICCAACWRKTRNIERSPGCSRISPTPVAAALPRVRRDGASGR